MTTTNDHPAVRTRRRRPPSSHAPAADAPTIAVNGLFDQTGRQGVIRVAGYLPTPRDVVVPGALAAGLRRGDLVAGTARDNGHGAPILTGVESVNRQSPAVAAKRPEFNELTPLYPRERLRLETDPATEPASGRDRLTNRLVDLVMPIGKGQRALVAAPPKAGKTTVLAGIANAIAANNPECRVMVVLVDERPEEVTEMRRTVRGEVIASPFDRPPADHANVAELAIERAKRLVELGEDVVVLLDNITRLGRAYNNSASSSGRVLTGGIDAAALYPPKRFLGAARNVEEGGSLTVIATALVETGSVGDSLIYEEYKGTGNAELRLDRRAAERRVFPAIDVQQSGTRHDDLLMGPDEYAALVRLRRVLAARDPQQALDLLIEQLRKTSSNAELLMQVLRTT